jgi:hypothetical protein
MDKVQKPIYLVKYLSSCQSHKVDIRIHGCLTYPQLASPPSAVFRPDMHSHSHSHFERPTTEVERNKEFSSTLNVDAAINLVTLGSFTCAFLFRVLRQQYR